MYVIAGVTGHTGAATAEALLSRSQKIRVVVRNAEKAQPWKRKGCEVAAADLSDPAAFASALEGAEGAFLLSPPNLAASDFLADRKAFLDRLVEGVKRSKVRNVVFLSSIGAQHAAGTGPIVTLHRAEQALREIAPSVTFIRAAYFLENWGSVVPVAKAQGVLPHFGATGVKFAQVGARDVGEAAARSLVTAADGTRVVELAGLQDWSVEDVAAAVGTLLGKPVKAVGAPLEAARPGLEQAGLPPEIARLLAEMYAAMANGLVAFERPEAATRGSTPLVDALRALV
jgi:NAD(P)H dehydrogenase (quinone)